MSENKASSKKKLITSTEYKRDQYKIQYSINNLSIKKRDGLVNYKILIILQILRVCSLSQLESSFKFKYSLHNFLNI